MVSFCVLLLSFAIFQQDVCVLYACCQHTVHHCSWNIVRDMVISTQMDGFHTYVKLGGLLQYLLHLKSGSVEVLLFPGIFMEGNGHKMEHSIKYIK